MKMPPVFRLLSLCYLFSIANSWTNVFDVTSTDELTDHLKELNDSTRLNIASGTYALSEPFLFEHYSQIALLGPEDGGTADIECVGEGGLSFIHSNSITIQNLTFSNCKTELNLNYTTINSSIHYLYCSDVTISSVTIKYSPGYALSLYNTAGTNTIEYSKFLFNGGYPEPIGGGVNIAFAECTLEDYCTDDDTNVEFISGSHYIINSNAFESNTASPGASISYLTRPSGVPGVGGALSCSFQGRASGNTIEMRNNNVSSNRAQYGGGVYIEFGDDTYQNLVTSSNDNITNNMALIPDLAGYIGPPLTAKGGGVMLVFGSSKGNKVYFNSSKFEGNFAMSNGGGVSVDSLANSTNQLVLDKVIMRHNIAKSGAGIYFSNDYPISQPLQVNLSDCHFYSNSIDGSCMAPSNVHCSGILYTNMLPLTFTGGSAIFRGNDGTPLHVHQTTVTIYSLTTAITGNSADYGGAVHLSGCGKIVVSHDIDFFFLGNKANILGGAIYETGCSSSQCFIQYLDSKLHPNHWNTTFFLTDNSASSIPNAIYTDSIVSCAYSQSSLVTQKDINETFCWNSWIYDTDILCHSVIQSGPAYIDIINNRTSTIDSQYDYTTLPGQPIYIDLKAYNVYGEEQIEEVTVCFHSGFGSLHSYFTDTIPDCFNAWTSDNIEVTLFGKSTSDKCDLYNGQSGTVSITTVRPPHLKLLTTIKFDQCTKPHYTFICPECYLNVAPNIGLKCVQSDSPVQAQCSLNSSLTTTVGNCWNTNNTKDITSLMGGPCPFSYSSNQTHISISNFTSSLCPENREGVLCSQCSPGYGVSMNTIDFKCIKCTGSDWIIVLGLEIVLITILIIALVSFSISLNAGGTNAFFFFAQVVTLKYPGLSYPSWVFEQDISNVKQYNDSVVRGFTLLYSITNLDVITPLPLSPFCISEQFNTVQAILLEFLPSLYPLIILGILYTCIALYSYKFKPIYIPAKAISKFCYFSRITYKPSLLDSFATIIIILFSRVTATCIKLFNPTFYYSLAGEWIGTGFYYDGSMEYFGQSHIIYIIVASVILFLFILMATLLTFSSCIVRCLRRHRVNSTRLLALISSFNESFKDGTDEGRADLRFFAGLYLYLRIVVHLLYLIHDPKLILVFEMFLGILVAVVFMIVRPYKYDNHNNVDTVVFLYLAFLAGLSASGYAYICYKGLLYFPIVLILGYAIYRLAKYVYTKLTELNSKYHQYSLLRPINSEEGSDEESEEADDQIRTAINIAQSNDSYNTEDMFADRLLNPDKYT